MELKKYKLADIGKVITGKTPSTSIAENYAWGTIPFYTPEDVAKGLGMMGRNSRFISKTGFEEIASNTISGESVLVGCIGSDMGNVAYSNITCATNQQINAITQFKNGIDPLYVYYLLSTMKSYFQKIAGSTTTPILPKSVFEEIEIHLPDMKKQKDVVSILYALDRKIELNKRINDNLEAMAKQLYDYWFVQFDFPNEEGKPYKSSGGAMVWNEKLKHEIPQKWSDCVLGDYIGRITNGLNPRKNFVLGNGNNYYVTIRSLVGTTIDWNNCDRCDDEALSKINSRSQLQIGDIIFSAIGTIGRTYYILEEPTNWNISETSFTLRAKENVPNDFFYGMLRSNEIQIKADKAAMGSTLRCLVMDSLCSLQYIEIPSYMMKLFAAKVSPLYRQIHRNNKEIAELTKQRDELLPLLMNGQASVNSD
ncbi:restriction endonuclease subunit S [Leyella stercorea]|uniref:restriction endonuclease subunit S n=1 Tax=Leyella stercorea TaxID=363265 RepID=UPI003AEF4408